MPTPIVTRFGLEYKWSRYLPACEEIEMPPLDDRYHVEPSSRLDPHQELTFLNGASLVNELTPVIGTEIRGVQISSLAPVQLDELSLLLARRGVLVFRNQDFREQSLERQKEIVSRFGTLYIHPTSPHIMGSYEHLCLYRSGDGDLFFEGPTPNKASTVSWHTDESFERQPPGATFLADLVIPSESGGDTEFCSMVAAYNRLSPSFRSYLETLTAIHSGVAVAEECSENGRHIRRAPVETEHPVVRVHPATGEKSLFVNKQFTTHIVGLKVEESEALLGFLYDYIAKSLEFHARVRWEDGTVMVWDNRNTQHTAITDYTYANGDIRHHFRLTATGERPVTAMSAYY